MFENLIAALKEERRTIVFTEGPDARILEATARLLKDDLMDVLTSRRLPSVIRQTTLNSM